MSGEKLITKRIQRRAPETVRETAATRQVLGGPVKEVLPLRQGAFLSAQQEDIASNQRAVPERDVPQEGGGGGSVTISERPRNRTGKEIHVYNIFHSLIQEIMMEG